MCAKPWDDTYGGLGCNAGGVGVQCRFCGFGAFASIPCPGDSSALTGELAGDAAAAALSREGAAELSTVPIIMVTAQTEAADMVAGLEAGADDYITKPFDLEELIARVRTVM